MNAVSLSVRVWRRYIGTGVVVSASILGPLTTTVIVAYAGLQSWCEITFSNPLQYRVQELTLASGKRRRLHHHLLLSDRASSSSS